MGHEAMPVYGLPRKSWKSINIVIRSLMIKNVRVKKVFNPKLIEMVNNSHFYSGHDLNLDTLIRFADSINENNKEIIE